jgi:predicted O-methyltransferase YrrM
MGFAIQRDKLEDAARVLACPVKTNPPNWQHGRVVYAAARHYFARQSGAVSLLDIGTAKGFSALCLLWAMQDARLDGTVDSVDVLDPEKPERRNTVAEVGGFIPLRQILAPWPESQDINFAKATGIEWMTLYATARIHVAFVDGKHSFEAVAREADLLHARQQPGDLVIFDDAQIDGVARAIDRASKRYAVEYLDPMPGRRYAVAVRRG